MLDALAPEKEPESPAPPQPTVDTPATTPAAEATGLTTDLVGVWSATAGESKIELSITEDSLFTWKVTTAGRPPVELSGNLSGMQRKSN